MSRVKINLYATLRRYLDGAASVDLEIEPGETVAEALEQLGVPPAHARTVFVDSRSVPLTHPLQGGEQVGVFPAIGGG